MIHGHGGDIYSVGRELGRPAREILDFSGNVSPLHLPEGLREVLVAHLDEIRHLPEVDSISLREALAARYALHPDQILVGSGTTEWIYALPRLLKLQEAVVALPTHADYGDTARLAGLSVRNLGPWPDADSSTTGSLLSALEAAANRGVRCLIYLCNPNNPTGRFIEPASLRELAEASPQASWVVDETYAPFVGPDEASSLLAIKLPENLVVLRSFSKICGVPGLRLGYAVGPRSLIQRLMAGVRPWAVSCLGQVAGVHLVGQTAYEDAVRAFCKEEKRRFLVELPKIAFLRPRAGTTHFVLFEVLAPWDAAGVAKVLREQGLLIRNCANFVGLEGEFVRISIRARDENDRLLNSLSNL